MRVQTIVLESPGFPSFLLHQDVESKAFSFALPQCGPHGILQAFLKDFEQMRFYMAGMAKQVQEKNPEGFPAAEGAPPPPSPDQDEGGMMMNRCEVLAHTMRLHMCWHSHFVAKSSACGAGVRILGTP